MKNAVEDVEPETDDKKHKHCCLAQEPKLGKLGGGTPSKKKMTRHEKRALSAVKNWLYNRQSYTARRQNGVIPLCLCTIFIALPALASLKTWSAPMKPVRLAPIAEVQTPNGCFRPQT